jgi:two-component system, NtrC family, response regulator
VGRELILIVDDDRNARTALRELLTEEGYDAAEACDGEEALSQIQRLAPDIVLSDLRMPHMDGLTLLRRAKDLGCDAGFVLMSAYALVQSALDVTTAGIEKFLPKPLDLRTLLAVLGRVCEARRDLRGTQIARGVV